MAGISRYEKLVLGITAAFLLLAGGWFLAHQNTEQPYLVTTTRNQTQQVTQQQESERETQPDSLMEGEVINVNTASAKELERLPGIGAKRAQAIVDYRESHGLFQSVEELDHVDAIGSGILAGLEGYVTVGMTEG